MKAAAVRLACIAGLVALVVICLTVLAALQVVNGDRVLDVLATMVPAAAGGWIGARGSGSNGNGNGRSLRPKPVVAPYEPNRP